MPNESLNVRSIFDRALEITSDAERAAYLDEVCARAPELQQQVDALLTAYVVAGSVLDAILRALSHSQSDRRDNRES